MPGAVVRRIPVSVVIVARLDCLGAIHKVETDDIIDVAVTIVVNAIEVARVKSSISINVFLNVNPKLANKIRVIDHDSRINETD